MERGLFAAASGMLADQIRQDVIANNLANATTAGFKGDTAVGEAFPSLLINQLQTGATIGKLGLGSRITEVATDGSQGALRQTGGTYDLAIAGDGWFSVQGPNGVAYTRNGAFTTDAKGQLVTADAQPVLDDGGRPITVGNNATISPDGRVTVDGRQVAKLAVTALDPKRLHKLGDNLYTGTVVKNAPASRVIGQSAKGRISLRQAGRVKFLDWQSQRRAAPLAPRAARLTRLADPPMRPDRHEARPPPGRLRRPRRRRA